MNKRNWALNQIAFQEQILKIGVNLVTCGSCGDVMFCKTDDEQIECICGVVSDAHDCPDLWYRGLEDNYEEPIEYKITKNRFLDWYFESGQDSENEEIRNELAEKMINSLFKDNTFTLNTNDIFENCNKWAIRLCYIEGLDVYDEREFIELGKNNSLILID
jgi:hypothetical protein